MNKLIKIIAIGLLLAGGAISYIYTAPYSGNAGLSRMPGVRIGGNIVEPPDDFGVFNDVGTNLIMKLDGFPFDQNWFKCLYSEAVKSWSTVE